MLALRLKSIQGDMEDYGLPKPDHRLGEAHPTVSSDLLPRIGHGRIAVRPNIARIDGGTVHFTDGPERRGGHDRLVHRVHDHLPLPAHRGDRPAWTTACALYRRVVPPDRPGLYFIGLVQPLGAIMPVAELQSEVGRGPARGLAPRSPPGRR